MTSKPDINSNSNQGNSSIRKKRTNRSSDDGSSRKHKKIKLDSLLQGLSLGDDGQNENSERTSGKTREKSNENVSEKTGEKTSLLTKDKAGNETEKGLADMEDENEFDIPSTHSFIRRKSSPKPPNDSPSYSVNPSLKLNKYSVFKPSSSSTPGSSSNSIDSYITDRLMEHFQNIIQLGNTLIHWYRPFSLIVYRFQKWTLRLFNRFLRKYNALQNNNNIGYKKFRPFKFYYKIMNLINSKEINFTYQDLINILDQETKLELEIIKKKRISREESNKNSDNEYSDINIQELKYNYWDRLPGLNKDLEMSESSMADDENVKLFELHDNTLYNSNDYDYDDMDMDMDNDLETAANLVAGLIESNYGLYYYDYRDATNQGFQNNIVADINI